MSLSTMLATGSVVNLSHWTTNRFDSRWRSVCIRSVYHDSHTNQVNFFGLLDCTREAMQIMREQKPVGGNILQITSVGGQNGVPAFSIYCSWFIESSCPELI